MYLNGRQFDEVHGDYVIIGERLIFQDGAWRDNQPGCGSYWEPTEGDEYERACNILKFWETKLKKATNAFYDLKRILRCKSESRNLRNPTSDEIAELRQLHKEVRQLKDAVEMAEAEVEKTLPQQQRERLARDESLRAEGASIAEEIEALEV